MKKHLLLCCYLAAGITAAAGADDFLDRVDDALSWAGYQGQLRARLSGTLSLEGYRFPQPAPGLLYTDHDSLLNPRLSLFLDAQLGPRVYVFAQSRLDHGFDPSEGDLEWRLDEYALRVAPRADGLINLQIGKFATVVGNWVPRSHEWGNPFITAPLPYENLTAMWDIAAVGSRDTLLSWAFIKPHSAARNEYVDKPRRLPVIWGPSYASGAAITGVVGKTSYAFEVKNGALSSRPAQWDAAQVQWQHPTFSGRLGYRPDERWNLGFSASRGTYLIPAARPSLAAGHTLDDYREIVLAQDLGFAWHQMQFWAECYEASFAIPGLGRAKTVAYYLEVKYKFTPQFFSALRWNQQLYGTLADGGGGQVRWGRNVWRIDFAPGYRFTPHTELKLQYSHQYGGIGESDHHSDTLAGQFVLRF